MFPICARFEARQNAGLSYQDSRENKIYLALPLVRPHTPGHHGGRPETQMVVGGRRGAGDIFICFQAWEGHPGVSLLLGQ